LDATKMEDKRIKIKILGDKIPGELQPDYIMFVDEVGSNTALQCGRSSNAIRKSN
jgi:hypothetical protein